MKIVFKNVLFKLNLFLVFHRFPIVGRKFPIRSILRSAPSVIVAHLQASTEVRCIFARRFAQRETTKAVRSARLQSRNRHQSGRQQPFTHFTRFVSSVSLSLSLFSSVFPIRLSVFSCRLFLVRFLFWTFYNFEKKFENCIFSASRKSVKEEKRNLFE